MSRFPSLVEGERKVVGELREGNEGEGDDKERRELGEVGGRRRNLFIYYGVFMVSGEVCSFQMEAF